MDGNTYGDEACAECVCEEDFEAVGLVQFEEAWGTAEVLG